ncbi:MAG: DUF4214 domain-containing protein [Acidimicrobiales bacterium]
MLKKRLTGVAVALSALATAVVAVPASPAGAEVVVHDIVLPVDAAHLDSVYWSDTFGAPRSGGRSHLGVDMMGPKGTPLLAAADGVITWFRHDITRGNYFALTADDGWKYHYSHMNNDTPGTDDGANPFEFAYAPGMGQGVRVTAGQLVGYMGDSGNAENSGSHLHFEIETPDGVSINPTPSVDAAKTRVGLPSIPASMLGPFDSTLAMSTDVFTTFTGREPTSAEAIVLANAVVSDGLASAIAPYVNSSSSVAQIDRLYVAYFLRRPDFAGLQYWLETRGSGTTVTQIADSFADGDEFKARYGELTFGDFVDQLYRDVLHREPDEAGKAYWLAELAAKRVTRGNIVVQFTEGQELIGLTAKRSEVVGLMALFSDIAPTDAEIDAWITARATMSLSEAIDAWFVNAG